MINSKGVRLLFLAAGIASPAMAQPLPNWNPAETCAKDSSPGQCIAFESRARDAVSGSWGVLLDGTKTACLDAVKSPLDRSWRLLADCIDEKTRGVLAKRNAIATQFTPAEPVPPPGSAPMPSAAPSAAPPGSLAPAAPAAATEGVPPPIFQLPTAAPRIE